jgi:hypothetical protein
MPTDLPSGEDMALLEDLFHFFERATDGFGEHEEDVDATSEVERSEDEVCLPGNCLKTRGYGECESSVECPVRGLERWLEQLDVARSWLGHTVARETAFPRIFKEY